MVCVGASFERRGMIWQKQSSNRCFWQASCVTGFSFYSLVQLSHRKFNWNVKASDTNQRDRKKWRGDTYNWSMILFSSHWYFHWIFHLLKLYITITSATWAFVWSQEFCFYLNYIIEDLQLVENFVDWQKEGEWELLEQKRHLVYIANTTICTLLHWTGFWFRHLGSGW